MAPYTTRRSGMRRAPAYGAVAGALVTAAALLPGSTSPTLRPDATRLEAFLPGPARTPGVSARSPRTREAPATRASASATGSFQVVDANYNPTWLDIKESSWTSLNWMHPQSLWAGAATLLYCFDMWRICNLIPPTGIEVFCAIIIYIGLYKSRMDEVPKLDKHYQISFYASVGWTVYALISLAYAMAYSPEQAMPKGVAEALHGCGSAVYLASCGYFYIYHWGRHIRHVMEGRFRPWFAAGLASLTAAHTLTIGHIFKTLEDPGWYKTVQQIYPQQWQWMADTRLLELYLTALALFLVILHLRGVVTGTKNAAIVFLGTVVVPTVALFGETFYVDAVAWQHYWMYGPKHW